MIGENIKKIRTKNSMTQKELAEKIFVTAQAISRWENGEVEPSISTVTTIAKIFGVTVDEIVGNPVEVKEPEVIVEQQFVYQDPIKPVLGVCETCNKPIYDAVEIVRSGSIQSHVHCKSCVKERLLAEKQMKINKSISRRKKSFWIGGLVAGVLIIFSIIGAVEEKDYSILLPNIIFSVFVFTYISCCILGNNFIGGMTAEIFSWGFVKMPGLIFTLDLEGIIWLLTVKLLFWVLGIILAIIFGVLGIILGGLLSIVVYPFAIVKNYKYPEKIELV